MLQQPVLYKSVKFQGLQAAFDGSTIRKAKFLYDMMLDDETREAFMASVDVKGGFLNTPHQLI